MKTKTTLLTSLAAVAAATFALSFSAPVLADKSAKNDSKKVWICHATSSAKNPFNLIEVSTNAAAAHYRHGDPTTFTIEGKSCSAGAPPPPPVATVDLVLNDADGEIDAGSETTVSWTTTGGVTACTLDDSETVYPGGTGTASIGPFASSATPYEIGITCSAPGGQEPTDQVLVTVVDAPVSGPVTILSLTVEDDANDSNTSISVGEVAIVRWTSTNATSCNLGLGEPSGATTLSYDAPGTYQLLLACSNTTHENYLPTSVTVVIDPPPPEPADNATVCAEAALSGSLVQTWEITYDRANGTFSGFDVNPDDVTIEGTVSPVDGLFTVGSTISFETDGGEIAAGSATSVAGTAASPLVRYSISPQSGSQPFNGTAIKFAANCDVFPGAPR